ncbi:IS5 family transposase [Rhizobium leguminosarum]|uniref:IS5 family transposase n=1 Tax=Rhizobium leguminosarum TaxID=384 RepID=UPI0021BBEF39|nr:IS5 family transposase [Rhizobium leguminosarum]
MWNPTTRRQYSRNQPRYETDLTDAERAVIAPLLPQPAPRGRKPAWPLREIINAIFYVLRGGIPWRLIPKDLPPKSTVFGYFCRWRDCGVFTRINHCLVMADRERTGRQVSPSAAVLDSQSVKITESGGPRGYDAGKRSKAASDKQWSIWMDALSCLILNRPTFRIAMGPSRFGACRGSPSRSWPFSRNRRLWKDPESTIKSAKAFLYAASIMTLVRRIARRC